MAFSDLDQIGSCWWGWGIGLDGLLIFVSSVAALYGLLSFARAETRSLLRRPTFLRNGKVLWQSPPDRALSRLIAAHPATVQIAFPETRNGQANVKHLQNLRK